MVHTGLTPGIKNKINILNLNPLIDSGFCLVVDACDKAERLIRHFDSKLLVFILTCLHLVFPSHCLNLLNSSLEVLGLLNALVSADRVDSTGAFPLFFVKISSSSASEFRPIYITAMLGEVFKMLLSRRLAAFLVKKDGILIT